MNVHTCVWWPKDKFGCFSGAPHHIFKIGSLTHLELPGELAWLTVELQGSLSPPPQHWDYRYMWTTMPNLLCFVF